MSSSGIFTHKLDTHETIFFDDIYAIISLYTYDSASTVRAAVSATGKLYKRLNAGEIYEYCDKFGVTKVLTFNGFKDFMLEYFDEFMYNETISYYYAHRNDKRDFQKESDIAAIDFNEKLDAHRIIRESELASLLYLYTCGVDSSFKSALKALVKLYGRLRKGERYEYCGKDGNINSLTVDNFREFMLTYFDKSIYCRTVSYEFKSCINDHRPVFYDDLESLAGLCKTDTDFAVDMLHSLMNKAYKDERCSYYDKSGKHCSLTKFNFKIFVTDYFGERIYTEVCRDFDGGKFRIESPIQKKPAVFNVQNVKPVEQIKPQAAAKKEIDFGDIYTLTNIYKKGAASGSIIKTVTALTGELYVSLRNGEKYDFYDAEGNVFDLKLYSFKEFMLQYFDEAMYCNAVTYEFQRQMTDDRVIQYKEIMRLADFCSSGEDMNRNAVIDMLCTMKKKLDNKFYCHYYDKDGNLYALSAPTFQKYATSFFGVRIYYEVLKKTRDNK